LITDADPSAAAPTHPSANELVLDRAILKTLPASAPSPATVSDLRVALDESQTLLRNGIPILSIAPGIMPAPDLARAALAAVLLNRSAALIDAGQELGLASTLSEGTPMPWGIAAPAVAEELPGPPKPAPVVAVPDKYTPYVPYVRPTAPPKPVPPDPNTVAGQEAIPTSMLNFYRQLSVLHHGGTALHDGEEITLNHDAQDALVWVRKPASPSQFNPPIVIACGFSDKPVVLSLGPDMTRLQLRGRFLRTLLRSDDAMGGTSIDPLTVPPHGVYVGELRY
jgi:alpha-glucosidase